MAKLLSPKDLKERGISYSREHLWRLCKDGKFPKPVKLSSQRNSWVEEEVDAWLKSKIEGRGEASDGPSWWNELKRRQSATDGPWVAWDLGLDK